MPQLLPAEKPALAGSFLPIRTVANLTGINPVTLRAWERRHNLITPRRTPKGHRLYTEDDVELIKQVLDLLDQGIAISQVKPLLEHLATGGIVLLVLGGLAYTGGLIFYAWDRLPYNHALWHVSVMIGSIFHFFAVLFYVL